MGKQPGKRFSNFGWTPIKSGFQNFELLRQSGENGREKFTTRAKSLGIQWNYV